MKYTTALWVNTLCFSLLACTAIKVEHSSFDCLSANLEVCNGVDDDCDGLVDEDSGGTRYADKDNDGYGDPNDTSRSCDNKGSYVDNTLDCNDTDPNAFPGAPETCNNRDDNCEGQVDEGLYGTSVVNLVGHTPESDATGSSTAGPITVTFDGPIAIGTVTNESFHVTGPKGDIAGTYSANSNSISFTPNVGLPFFSPIQVALTSMIKTSDCANPIQATSFGFNTGDASWSETKAVTQTETTFNQSYGGLRVTYNNQYQATALWTIDRNNSGTPQANLWASHLGSEGTWSTPIMLDTLNNGYLVQLGLSAGVDGNAYAIWQQLPLGMPKTSWARFFDGTTWEDGSNLDPATNIAGATITSVGANAAIAAWIGYPTLGGPSQVSISRHHDGQWSGEQPAFTANELPLQPVAVANKKGQAIVCWSQSSTIGCTRFNEDGVAQPSTTVAIDIPLSDNKIDVGIDEQGVATVVWPAYVGDWYAGLYVSRQTADNDAWSEPELVASSDEREVLTQVIDIAVAPNGQAMLAWVFGMSDTILEAHAFANFFDGNQWLGQKDLSTSARSVDTLCAVTIDSHANAVVVWKNQENLSLEYNRYLATNAQWSGATLLPVTNVKSCHMAGNEDGYSLLAWLNFDAIDNKPSYQLLTKLFR